MQATCPLSTLEDPDDFNHTHELKDFLQIPIELNFEGIDPHAPPPIMEPYMGPSGPGQPDMDGDEGPKRFGPERAQSAPKYGLAQRAARTAMHSFQEWENTTGIPFYREWLNIEQSAQLALNEAEFVQNPLRKMRDRVQRKADRTNIQLLFEAKAAGRVDEAKKLSAGMTEKHAGYATELDTKWREFTKRLGFDDDEYKAFFSDFPTLRRKEGDFGAYVKAKTFLPRLMKFIQGQMEREHTVLRLDERETDFYSLGMRLSRMMAYEKHLTEPWNETMKKMEQYMHVWRDDNGNKLPDYVSRQWKNYLDAKLHVPDEMMQATLATSGRIIKHADAMMRKATFGKMGLGSTLTEKDRVNLLDVLSTSGYLADLVANPGTFTMQFLQLTQLTIPRLGAVYGGHGLRYATQWGKEAMEARLTGKMSPLIEDMRTRGITGQTMGLGEDFAKTSGAMASTALTLTNRALEAGLAPMQFADSFTRVASYMGKHHAVMTEGKKYLEGKLSWQEFRERSRLDLQEEGHGVLHREVKMALDAGDVQTAAHRAAHQFQIDTNFLYTRGNAPAMLEGTMGRYLGRYGTWPMSFISSQWQLAKSGDKMLTKNKLFALGSTIALNAAVMTAVEEVFDADASKWAVWNALEYRGGPFVRLTYDLGTLSKAAIDGNWETNEVRMAKSRTEGYFGTHIIPGTQSFLHLKGTLEAVEQGDIQGAFRAFLGFPQREPPQQ